MSEMGLIMESWRSYRVEQLDEGCRGEACLDEYKVLDFINDVSEYTGHTKRIAQKIEQALKDNPDDNRAQTAGKKLLGYVQSKGLGWAIKAGVVGVAGLITTPAGGLAAAAFMGTPFGDAIADGLQGALGKGTEEVMAKLLQGSQVNDPPTTPRGWILDMNDQMEKLMKGGEEDSGIYREFSREVLEKLKDAHADIDVETDKLAADLAGGVLDQTQWQAATDNLMDKPMRDFMGDTVNQQAIKYVKNHELTKDLDMKHGGYSFPLQESK